MLLPSTEPVTTVVSPIAVEPFITGSTLDELVAILPPSFSEADLTDFATGLTGTVTFADGIISADLTTAAETFSESIDAAAEITALLDDLTGITATVGIEGGVATLDGTTETGDTLMGSLDFNAFTDSVILPLIGDIEGAFTIDGGIITVDLDTDAGAIDGELSLLDGELSVVLDTPFGALDEAIAFDEDTEFTVPFGDNEATFNLFAGTVTINPDTADATTLNFSDIPLTVAVDDGLATIEIAGLGTIGDPFDIESFLSELITPIIANTDGELTLSNGVLEGFLDIAPVEDTEPDGPVDPTPVPGTPADPAAIQDEDISVLINITQLLTDTSDFLTSLTGTLTFGEGTATSTVVSADPDLADVDLTGEFDLVGLVDEAVAVAEILDVFGLIEIEEPVVETPTTEDPMTEDPVVDDPMAGDPVVDDPMPEGPVVDDPVVDDPVVDVPAVV